VRPVNGQPLLASIRAGDTLTRVNGIAVRTWTDAIGRILRSDDSVRIETNRAAVTVTLARRGAPSAQAVAEALGVRLPPVIGDVIAGEPAARAGLRGGDTVVTIDGVRVEWWADMVVLVSRAPERALTLEVGRRDGRTSLTVTPRALVDIDPLTGERGRVGKIGAVPLDVSVREPVSAGEAVAAGVRATWFMGTSIIGTVRDLVTRRVSMDQLGGPIAITRASVQAARGGMESLLYLIALLSVNVAILNLLPIPILDGGQILINVLESAKGSPFSLRAREYILRGGLLVILLLFVLVMFNDTKAWLIR
jgi:regulator of sigma E protease